VKSYTKALKAAQAYGQGIVLRLILNREMSYAYALLHAWPSAEQHLSRVRELLGQVDSEAYDTFYVRLLDLETNLHLEKGEYLVSKRERAQAFGEYRGAYVGAHKQVQILTRSQDDSDDLVIAYINVAKSLWGLQECSDSPKPRYRGYAQRYLRKAIDIARSLGMYELEREAEGYLGQYCHDGKSEEQT